MIFTGSPRLLHIVCTPSPLDYLTPDVRRAVLELAVTGHYGESASRAAFGCPGAIQRGLS